MRTHTVIKMDNVTRIMVNSKYFPNNGIAKEVGGIISASNKKNTVSDKRIEEHSDTCKQQTILIVIFWRVKNIMMYLPFHQNHLASKILELSKMWFQHMVLSSWQYKTMFFFSL